MSPGGVFGFVSEDVVNGLQAYGNWKLRQGAMDALLAAIEQTDLRNGNAVEIPAFLDFLFGLMDDPNFKIKQGSLQTMHLFIRKTGKRIEFHLRLAAKLSDPKDYVREGCSRIFRVVAEGIGAVKLVLLLGHSAKSCSRKTREEIVKLLILLVLLDERNEESSESLKQYLRTLVLRSLKEATQDGGEILTATVVEGLRLVRSHMADDDFWTLVNERPILPNSVVETLRLRCQEDIPLPIIEKDGLLVIQALDSIPASNPAVPVVQKQHSAENERHGDVLVSASGGEVSEPPVVSVTTVLEGKMSLRSHPLSEKVQGERSSSDESEATQPTIPVPAEAKRVAENSHPAEISERPEKAVEIRKKDVRSLSPVRQRTPGSVAKTPVERQTFFRRLFENAAGSGGASVDDALSSLRHAPAAKEKELQVVPRENSGVVAARINRIAQLIRERDAPQRLHEDVAVTSKSASLANKRRENLNVLKMKQKDRRTHSANAVLQRRMAGTKTEALAPRGHDPLPSILSNSSQRQPPWPRSAKRVATSENDGRSRGSTLGSVTGRIPLDTTVFFERDADEESYGFASSPGSVIHTRPGTLASAISTAARVTLCDVTETKSFIDPDAVLESTIDRLQRANSARKKEVDWISQAEALNDARRLVYHHPILVKKRKREFVTAFVPAMQQLRSTTARTAIMLCQEIFEALGDGLDHEVDDIVPLLLKKAGETSNAGRDTFLASEADKALSLMIRSVSFVRSLAVLVQHANNSSKYVRCKVAAHLDDALCCAATRLSADVHLSLIDRIFKVGVSFLEEGALDTRTYGKRILWGLKGWINNRGAFQRLMGQLESETKRRRVRDVFENVNGPPPLPGRSAGLSRRKSNGSSLTPLTPSLIPPGRANSHDTPLGSDTTARPSCVRSVDIDAPNEGRGTGRRAPLGGTIQRPPKPMETRRREQGVDMPEYMSEALTYLTAKDWRTRIGAVQQLESAAGKLRFMHERDVLNVMDQLTYRLNDGNAKVVLVTLETIRSVFEKTGRSSIPALNTVVPALVSNLAASSEKIRLAAEVAVDALIDNVDNVHLVQSLSHGCAHGNPRTKATLLQKLNNIVLAVHSRKPQLVTKYILPVAFSSLSDIRLDVRQANAALLRHLAQTLGSVVIEHAEVLTGTSRHRLVEILQGNY